MRRQKPNPFSKPQPVLKTPRLRLCPLTLRDAPAIQSLAGAKAVAEMTLLIPHPYADGLAEKWITQRREDWKRGVGVACGIHLRQTNFLVGAVGLGIHPEFAHAELGYWIGVPFWGKGYCTEAARELVRFGFEVLKLHRIFAHHFGRNPASGRVLQKIGMRYEGCHREHVRRWRRFEDLECYALLARETGVLFRGILDPTQEST